MKYSLWDAARTLVFCDKISHRWLRRFPSNKGMKEGYGPLQCLHSTAIGPYRMKMVTGRHRQAVYHNKH